MNKRARTLYPGKPRSKFQNKIRETLATLPVNFLSLIINDLLQGEEKQIWMVKDDRRSDTFLFTVIKKKMKFTTLTTFKFTV